MASTAPSLVGPVAVAELAAAVLASARCTAPSWLSRARWWPRRGARRRRGRPGRGGRAGRRRGDLGEVHAPSLVGPVAVAELAAAVLASARCTAPSWLSRARW